MADTDTPFVWGAGGEQLTPGQLSSRRKIAEAMMAQGMDSSPIRSPWQGVDRMAKAMFGAYQTRQADDQEAAARQGAIAQLMSALGGPSAAGSPVAAASPSGGLPATPAGAPAASAAAPAPPGDAAAAIASIESGGKYDLLGPVTKTGDRAYGKYQVMGANVPQWTKTHLGQAMTPEQFLASPEAQDAVFKGQFGQYAQKYGPEGAAKAWFAGEHGMTNPNARDQLGTTVQAYADRFSKAYGAPAPAAVTDPAALPVNAQSAEGAAIPGQPSAGVQTVMSAMPQGGSAAAPVPPASVTRARPGVAALVSAMSNPFLPPSMAAIAAAQLKPREMHNQVTDADGNIWDVNQTTGQRTVALQRQSAYGKPYRDDDGNLVQRDNAGKISVISAADKTPNSVSEYKYYTDNFKPSADQQAPMDYATWSTAKARAAATNITNNVDMNSGTTYDKQLAEGLGKVHAGLATGVEDAQTRARDISAMQGAVDAIQKNGGTTGGLAPEQTLRIQKALNSGAAAMGLDKVFDEKELSDKEFLTKFNRSMAGAAAKSAVGSRVTNFEMSNYLKANPGLDMSVTGNQRLLGIQAQIEQRNIAVGNAIREATAQAISQGKKIDPVTVQKIITDYDNKNHVSDPVTGQDLTQSYVLPEFQQGGTNPSLAAGHDANLGKIRKYNPQTGALE
ncbi:hypothetical protein JJC00_18825 [Bradyrhizobium diazoefficiens]|uniref:hypothetical protein n=1 Tax=Bradyrhizobium diazoefficiens TaxID=1355477 RepID=UPI00190CCED8|nr:hypothetical protein [Bradyrhizobium diazoefficiens]QQO30739.1 hypothetical protein JJC00_18825 [Bradyrhizobium diazoefficiens]